MPITATAEELENLRQKILSGDKVVEADGRRLEMRSLDEMLRIQQEATPAAGGGGSEASGGGRRRYVQVDSGW